MAGMLLMGMYWYVSWQDDILLKTKIRVAHMAGVKHSFGSRKILSNDSTWALKKEMLTLIRA